MEKIRRFILFFIDQILVFRITVTIPDKRGAIAEHIALIFALSLFVHPAPLNCKLRSVQNIYKSPEYRRSRCKIDASLKKGRPA